MFIAALKLGVSVSYEKAMKHARNVQKVRKQGRMYMGFDTGSGSWPSIRSHPYWAAAMHVRDWYKDRNKGSCDERRHTRECIREAVFEARRARAEWVERQEQLNSPAAVDRKGNGDVHVSV